MYEFPDNGLQIKILTYSKSIDSIIQPDPWLIQLSVLQRISAKDLSRSYSELITVLVVELV